jgi:Tol biopolymer transport system component/tRNA A-37 threonylcarbamoyl transferase component Bud32
MSLAPGTRVGPYAIAAPLGAGGMGEVYAARDRSLNRNVAIKILPAAFATDPDRLARFTREAHTLAQLNHPHIAHVYGFEDSGGVKALVMELVEGPTLADLLTGGAIGIADAIDIARQIADALEAAHDLGIVHRDLKPANVKVRPDGVVKVLDFGLAKAMVTDQTHWPDLQAIADSPTLTSPAMTQVGVILGTAAYMAPEQARGKPIDRRADIWAFGCVLFETLAGRRPFNGETVTDILSAIVSQEPDWTALPSHLPAPVAHLVRRCLQKDPRKRLRDIGEARLVLEAPHAAADDRGQQARPLTRPHNALLPALAAATLLLALTTGWLVYSRVQPRQPADETVTRFDVQPPNAESALTLVFRPAVALSSNGSTLAFVAATGGIDGVYVRSRGDTIPRLIQGSEGGSSPALSPDGKWVAFFANGKIKKAPIDGEATTIGTARDVRGISWTDDGALVLTENSAAPLERMPSEGGPAQPLTTLATGERTHRWVDALPGGRRLLFTVGTIASPDTYDAATIEALDTATGERRVVITGAGMARYCGDGRLLYTKGPGLFSVGFDPERLTTSGTPAQVVPAVARDPSTGAAHFACSRDGMLAFVPATSAAEQRHLVWADETGRLEPVNLPPGPHQEVRVSPDGKRAALLAGRTGNGDVWIYEFANATFNRLTFTATNAAPIWSADGRTVYYTSIDSGGTASLLMKKPWDGAQEAVALGKIPGRAYAAWVDSAEQTAIIDLVNPASDRGDIVRLGIGRTPGIEKLVASGANEFATAVSPSGQWLAYNSDETGRSEIWVHDLTGGARFQVTSAGGQEPHWSGDGRQLFYASANRLMAMPIEAGKTFRHGQPRPLFDGIYSWGIESGRSYDRDPTTARFLLVRPVEAAASQRTVRMVLGWMLDLQDRSPR